MLSGAGPRLRNTSMGNFAVACSRNGGMTMNKLGFHDSAEITLRESHVVKKPRRHVHIRLAPRNVADAKKFPGPLSPKRRARPKPQAKPLGQLRSTTRRRSATNPFLQAGFEDLSTVTAASHSSLTVGTGAAPAEIGQEWAWKASQEFMSTAARISTRILERLEQGAASALQIKHDDRALVPRAGPYKTADKTGRRRKPPWVPVAHWGGYAHEGFSDNSDRHAGTQSDSAE